MQLIKAPHLLLSNSPADFTFLADDVLLTDGQAAQNYLTFQTSSMPAAAQVMELQFGGKSLVFTFGTPDGINPFLIPAYVSGPERDYLVELAKALNRVYDLYSVFDIYLVEPEPTATVFYLALYAKSRGDNYNITLGGGTTATIANTALAAVNDELPKNFALHMQLTLLADHVANPTPIVTELQANGIIAPAENKMVATFHDLPMAATGALFSCEPQSSDLILLCRHLTAKYGFKVTPVTQGTAGIAVTDADFNLPGHKYVLRAGLPVAAQPIDDHTRNLFTSATNKFLTDQPRFKAVLENQPEWLYFLATEPLALKAVFTVYYTDNSSAAKSVNFSSLDIGVFCIPCGYLQQQLQTYAGSKTAYKYTVQIQRQDNSGSVCETFTYALDKQSYANTQFLIFENAYSGYDTLRTHAEVEQSASSKREINSTAITTDSSSAAGMLTVAENVVTKTLKLRSGYLETEEEYLWLMQLSASRNVYRVLDAVLADPMQPEYKRPILERLVLQADKQLPTTSTDNVFAHEWELQIANSEVALTQTTPLAQRLYDSVFEMTLHITALSNLSQNISFGPFTSTQHRITINGLEVTPPFGLYNVQKTGTYHIRIEALDITQLTFSVTSGITGTFKVTRIESPTLQQLTFGDMDNVTANVEWLCERLSRMATLVQFTAPRTTGSATTDSLLLALEKCYNTYGRLTTIGLLKSNAPGTLGLACKDYLQAEGLTVNTN